MSWRQDAELVGPEPDLDDGIVSEGADFDADAHAMVADGNDAASSIGVVARQNTDPVANLSRRSARQSRFVHPSRVARPKAT